MMKDKPKDLLEVGVVVGTHGLKGDLKIRPLPTGDLAEKVYNYGHVFIDLSGQEHITFPYWPGFSEWEQLWIKWMDPVFVEGDPNIEEALREVSRIYTGLRELGVWLEGDGLREAFADIEALGG